MRTHTHTSGYLTHLGVSVGVPEDLVHPPTVERISFRVIEVTQHLPQLETEREIRADRQRRENDFTENCFDLHTRLFMQQVRRKATQNLVVSSPQVRGLT